MKKYVKQLLCAALTIALVLSLAACGGNGGNSGAAEVGTWTLTDAKFVTIEQGKLVQTFSNTITLFSDNTYILSAVQNTYYSSDSGETFNPTYYANGSLYGTYETVSEDEELGEITVKIKSVTRIVTGDGIDTNTSSATDDYKTKFLTNSVLNGHEFILGSDYRMSEWVDTTELFVDLGN